jgi:uncharacterized protein YdaU (DUF1376 family)
MGLPYFPFNAADWVSSPTVMMMTPAERGAYIQLLALAWLDKDCGIPDDDLLLARLAGFQTSDGASLNLVRRCFVKHPSVPNKLINERLYQEWLRAERLREQQVERGKRSAQTRGQGNAGSTTVEPRLSRGSTPVQPPFNAGSTSESESESENESERAVAREAAAAADARPPRNAETTPTSAKPSKRGSGDGNLGPVKGFTFDAAAVPSRGESETTGPGSKVPENGSCAAELLEAAENLAWAIERHSKRGTAQEHAQRTQCLIERINELGVDQVTAAVTWWIRNGPSHNPGQWGRIVRYPDAFAVRGGVDRLDQALRFLDEEAAADDDDPPPPPVPEEIRVRDFLISFTHSHLSVLGQLTGHDHKAWLPLAREFALRHGPDVAQDTFGHIMRDLAKTPEVQAIKANPSLLTLDYLEARRAEL